MNRTSKKGIELIKEFEGFRSKPYLDSAGIPTIGYGFTIYPDGKKVTLNDKPITKEKSEEILKLVLRKYEQCVNELVKKPITQNQFDALVSFTYNVGCNNLKKSTLLKKVNKDPSDISIKEEFLKWNKAGGKELTGLTRRRKKEAILYFSNI